MTSLRDRLLAKGWTLSAAARRWGLADRTLRAWQKRGAPAWCADAIAGMPECPAEERPYERMMAARHRLDAER